MRLGFAYALSALGLCGLVLTQTNFLPWRLVSVNELTRLHNEIARLSRPATPSPSALRKPVLPAMAGTSLDRGAYNTNRAVIRSPNPNFQ